MYHAYIYIQISYTYMHTLWQSPPKTMDINNGFSSRHLTEEFMVLEASSMWFQSSYFDALILHDQWLNDGQLQLRQSQTGWWFGTFWIFPYNGSNHPNWRTHIFQRGWSTTNQSLTSHWPNMTSFVGPLVPISGRGIVMICLEMGFPKIQRFIILPSTCHFVSIQHLQIQIQHWCVRYA